MKKFMRQITILGLVFINVIWCAPIISAKEISTATDVPNIVAMQDDTETRNVEYVWIERTNENGKKQKRLWCVTYQRWMTDWIDVD